MAESKAFGRPGIRVKHLLDGRVYMSMSEASRATGIPVATVYRHCHGKVRPKFRKFILDGEE